MKRMAEDDGRTMAGRWQDGQLTDEQMRRAEELGQGAQSSCVTRPVTAAFSRPSLSHVLPSQSPCKRGTRDCDVSNSSGLCDQTD